MTKNKSGNEPANEFHLQENQWSKLNPEQKEFFNHVYSSIQGRKNDLIKGVKFPQDCRESLDTVLTKVITECTLEAVTSYNRYIPEDAS